MNRKNKPKYCFVVMDTEVDVGTGQLVSSGSVYAPLANNINTTQLQNNTSSGGGSSSSLLSGIGSLAVQSAADISLMITNLLGKEVQQKGAALMQQANSKLIGLQSAGESFDDLSKVWQSTANINNVTKSLLGYLNGWQMGTNAFASAAKGAAAGSGLGPWGMVGGAIGGLATSLIGGFGKNRKAKLQTIEVNKQIAKVNNFNKAALSNRASNISSNRMTNLKANYAAFGGPIGALDYDFILLKLNTDALLANNQINKISAMPNSFMNLFAFGGHRNGGQFSNGLTYVGEGGTHEQNPHQGVLMGHDEQGNPNLVEEGEYIWNNYVFSNRLRVPKDYRKSLGLGNSKNGYTFAEAVDFLQRESEERPTDPISNSTLEHHLSKLASIQELLRLATPDNTQANKFGDGGKYVTGKGKNKTHTEEYLKNVIDLIVANPGDSWERILTYLKTNPNHELYSKALGIPELRPFLTGHKSIYDLTDDEAAAWKGKFTDFDPGDWYDIANVISYTDVPGVHMFDVPYNSIEIGNDGSVVTTPIVMPDNIGNYKGSKRGLTSYINSVNESGVSVRDRLEAMGYDVGTMKMTDTGITIRKKGQSDTNTAKSKVKPTTTYYIGRGENAKKVEGDPVEAIKLSGKNLSMVDLFTDADGNITYFYDEVPEEIHNSPWSTARYAPIAGSLAQVITDSLGVTNTPDYSGADMVLSGANNILDIGFTPIDNYMTYNPIDQNYLLNNVAAQALSSKRGILNNSGLNRGLAVAGLLANDYNSQTAAGTALIEMDKYNKELQLKVADFNRETDKFNSLGFLQAGQANIENDKLRNTAIQSAAALRQQEREATESAKAANMSNLFTSLGNLGREQFSMDMIMNNKALLYDWMGRHKNDILNNILTSTNNNNTAADGGYLTIKKRRRK